MPEALDLFTDPFQIFAISGYFGNYNRISQFPREPFDAYALLSGPGRIFTPLPVASGAHDAAPACLTTKAPTLIILSRLYHTASASAPSAPSAPSAIADDYAMFASGRWRAFSRRASSPEALSQRETGWG